jgi:hypothetical protein
MTPHLRSLMLAPGLAIAPPTMAAAQPGPLPPARCQAHLDLLAQIAVRDGEVMAVDIDVVVEPDTPNTQFSVEARFGRQRPQSRFFDPFEQLEA